MCGHPTDDNSNSEEKLYNWAGTVQETILHIFKNSAPSSKVYVTPLTIPDNRLPQGFSNRHNL